MAGTVTDEKRRAMLSYISTFEPGWEKKSQTDIWRKYISLKVSQPLETFTTVSTTRMERLHWTISPTQSHSDGERQFYLNFLGDTAANRAKSLQDLEYAFWKAQP